jgi:methylenetetrahydrofolate dehydrogenase (NADP+)/methenyltetrahydrofolate cyclohydrolase
MTRILDGKSLSLKIRQEIKASLQAYASSPHLVVLLTHPHLASSIYVRNKLTACKEVGIRSTIIEHTCTTTEQVLRFLEPWNTNDDVDGILVQFPLHPHVNQRHVMEAITPSKDVDGVHPINLGKLVVGDPSGFIPCTPLGIQTLLTHYDISPKGTHVVIVGRSVTVGKPLALLLSLTGPTADATVTIANRSTHDLASLCKTADILIAAAGSPGLITPSMIKEGAVVVDVGINRIQTDEKIHLVGDVDFAKVSERCSAITPVPGGVGPMTIASLLQNTLKAFSSNAHSRTFPSPQKLSRDRGDGNVRE